jgi:hypothetical protein
MIHCHENVLTETLATKEHKFYCWLRYHGNVFTEALPGNGHIPSQYTCSYIYSILLKDVFVSQSVTLHYQKFCCEEPKYFAEIFFNDKFVFRKTPA